VAVVIVTAFLWGLGVSLGAAIGALFYVLALDLLQWLLGRADEAKQQVDAMLDQNEIAKTIAFNLQCMAEIQRQAMVEKQRIEVGNGK
jgi:hypothetical protein